MENVGSLPFSQEPATGHYPESGECSPHTHTIFSKISLILFFHLRLALLSYLFSLHFSIKILYAFLISPMRATCPIHLTHLYFITLIIFGKEYNYEVPHYVIFCILPIHVSVCCIFSGIQWL